MKKFGWHYKGTNFRVRIGHNVKVSKALAATYGSEVAKVIGLQGFITVEFPNGDKVDVDARSLIFIPFVCDHCKREVEVLYPHTSYDRVTFKPQKEQICKDCADFCDMEDANCESYQEDPENFIRKGEP